MIIYGVAFLAFCTLVGIFIGELLGKLIGVPAMYGIAYDEDGNPYFDTSDVINANGNPLGTMILGTQAVKGDAFFGAKEFLDFNAAKKIAVFHDVAEDDHITKGSDRLGIVDRLTTGVAALLKKNKVQVIQGWAKVIDGKTVEIEGTDTRIQCEHLLLATGSKSVNLPMLPIGGPIISSTEALAPKSLPKRLIVVGGGYIGLELGIAYRKLGAEVSVVEAQERILPAYDAELTQPVHESLKQLGVKLYLKHSVTGFEHNRLQVRDPKGDTVSLAADGVPTGEHEGPVHRRLIRATLPRLPGAEPPAAASGKTGPSGRLYVMDAQGKPQALIVAPTRELALQVSGDLALAGGARARRVKSAVRAAT